MNAITNLPVIGLHGAPRSGTSWLGQLFNSHAHVAYRYQPFFSWAFRGQMDADSSAADIRRMFNTMLNTKDTFVLQTGDASLARKNPQFTKTTPTHLVYKEVRFHDLMLPILEQLPEARIIGIIRNPLDVLTSWMNAPREFKPEWNIYEEWWNATQKNAGLAENWYGYARWKELALIFRTLQKQYPTRFYLVRYEDLQRDPESIVQQLFAFCELSMGAQTQAFIRASTSRDDGDPYGVYRTGNHKHANALPSDIIAAVRQDLAASSLTDYD